MHLSQRPRRSVHSVRAARSDDGAARAGQWRGLDVAIKTVQFQAGALDSPVVAISNEAAIASNLNHPNIVATYAHDIADVTAQKEGRAADSVYKFYLVQVRVPRSANDGR